MPRALKRVHDQRMLRRAKSFISSGSPSLPSISTVLNIAATSKESTMNSSVEGFQSASRTSQGKGDFLD